jgi:hypothetical protein
MRQALLLAALLVLPRLAAAQPSGLFFSEYVEGAGNDKALEIYNGTGAAVDLAAAGYAVQIFFNGSRAPGLTLALGGVVADGDVHVVAHASAAASILARSDETFAGSGFNGNDAVALLRAGAIVDVIGQIGVDPGAEWGAGFASTADDTLRRRPGVCAGDAIGNDVFDPTLEWMGLAPGTVDGLGTHRAPCLPEDVCALPYTPIPAIQGSGAAAAILGSVTTQGVVVGDFEQPTGAAQLRGFYLQDPAGDGDAATSDGLFVFDGGADNVDLGELVRVAGVAGESLEQTQIDAVSVERCGTGGVTPVDVTLPLPAAGHLERFEGMLVRLPQTLFVTDHFQLGRLGQVVVSSGGRLAQPTNVVAPGPAAAALQAANDLDRLIVDDATNLQSPDPILFGRGGAPLSAANTLRGGDTTTGIVGVLTFTSSGSSASGPADRLRPVGALGGSVALQPANARPVAAPPVTGSLRVASMNLQNFFDSFGPGACALGAGGPATDCRGADDAAELARQSAKLVAAILGAGADVVGVTELENDGYAAVSAVQTLADALNAASAPGTFAFVDADAATGRVNALGTDAIKVGLFYRPARVTPVGITATLDGVAFVRGGDATDRNRPALAQAFEERATGARFVVSVNHWKSKGSACDAPDAGDGQGHCNAVRAAAARELAAWLAGDPTGTGDPDVLIVGDLNAYALEDPVTALASAGYTRLARPLEGALDYSYAFDGQWGSLDHALASASLAAKISRAQPWHVNADEPAVLSYDTAFESAAQIADLYAPDAFRASDHDPLLVDLSLAAPDADGDGVPDAADDCPFAPNGAGEAALPGIGNQRDSGGVGLGSSPDGVGDACQCGDVTGDGRVTLADAAAVVRALLAPPTATLAHADRCDVAAGPDCSLADAVALRRALLAPATGTIAQRCAPALP